VWEALNADTFDEGAAKGFNRITRALREYAVAGVLHLEHFASVRTSPQYALVQRRTVSELCRALTEPLDAVAQGLDRLLRQHAKEWSAFTTDLGPRSFVSKWINSV
jgi:hypothetical protein